MSDEYCVLGETSTNTDQSLNGMPMVSNETAAAMTMLRNHHDVPEQEHGNEAAMHITSDKADRSTVCEGQIRIENVRQV